MSRIRSLRARLDRLTQTANNAPTEKTARVYDFTIDPALANALRDDHKRLDDLRRQNGYYNSLSTKPPETEEERMLLARIAERAETIALPAGYGLNEVWDDRARLDPWLACMALNDVEDVDAAEEAQVIARIEAFNHSPEGRARERISELQHRSMGWMTRSEHSELDELLALYPEPDIHPKDPMRDSLVAMEKILEDGRKDRLKSQERLAKKLGRSF